MKFVYHENFNRILKNNEGQYDKNDKFKYFGVDIQKLNGIIEYVATDIDGAVYGYSEKPIYLTEESGNWVTTHFCVKIGNFEEVDDSFEWSSSLRKVV